MYFIEVLHINIQHFVYLFAVPALSLRTCGQIPDCIVILENAGYF